MMRRGDGDRMRGDRGGRERTNVNVRERTNVNVNVRDGGRYGYRGPRVGYRESVRVRRGPRFGVIVRGGGCRTVIVKKRMYGRVVIKKIRRCR